MAEIDRIHPIYGAGFGNDFGQRIQSTGDRRSKGQGHSDNPQENHDDSVEIHDVESDESASETLVIDLVPDHGLDISA